VSRNLAVQGCQRYWTAGGTLRNVPVGAGRRKNKSTPARDQGKLPDVVSQISAAQRQQLAAAGAYQQFHGMLADPARAAMSYR
jgi:Dof domain, zinc finger